MKAISQKGFTLIELMMVMAIIGILALIAIPHFMTVREKSLDRVAKIAGASAKVAEGVYQLNSISITNPRGTYTSDLGNLIAFDRNLTDDEGVTFIFLHASLSGFMLYTKHAGGTSATFLHHD